MTQNRRYRISEKSIVYHRLFLVLDDEDKTVYMFHYEYNKLGKQLVLVDSSSKASINIRQINHVHPTFDIYAVDNNDHHHLLGVLRRIGPVWHHKYVIESIYGEYKIDRTGRLFSHAYKLMEDEQLIAKINEQGRESDELVSIEIEKDVDAIKDPFILGLVMILETL